MNATYDTLKQNEMKQRAEEEELDRQLGEYENLMNFVDTGTSSDAGRSASRRGAGAGEGGFRQVVEDMARVRREMEECRKDLRRLGWTGD